MRRFRDERGKEIVLLTRREAIALMGAAGMASIAGCPTLSTDNGSGNDNAGENIGGCIVTPELTEGPYFVDEKLNRSDIRVDPSDNSIQDGAPFTLKLTVSQIANGVCSALAGATVDIWHCNAEGDYSDEAANGTVGQKWLRGYQVTDADGAVEFTTIYPGWYSGRTPHIHFKVRKNNLEFTSQFFFDEAVTAAIYAQSPYKARGAQDVTNARDTIYRDGMLLTLSPEGEGYLGTFAVALQT